MVEHRPCYSVFPIVAAFPFHRKHILPVTIDTRVFSNLLSNVQKYAHSAVISVGKREDGIQITIDDDGPGIPAKKRVDAFKPFFRLDKSRNSSTGGVGLGLTIVRDSILAHGGSIKLETSPQKGLRVLITLPEKVD